VHAPRLIEMAVLFDLPSVVGLAVDAGWKPETKLPGGATLGTLARLSGAVGVETLLAGRGGAAWRATAPPLVAGKTEQPPDTRVPTEGPPALDVEMELIIGESGAVLAARPIACPDGRLAVSCIQTLSTWRFAPPTRGGQPVAVRVTQVFAFPALTSTPIDRAFVDAPPIPITRWIPPGNGGEVRLVCIVDPTGHASDFSLYDRKDEVLARQAAEFAPEWAFTPAILRGARVPVRVEVTVPFR
jgi:hypothetical protein